MRFVASVSHCLCWCIVRGLHLYRVRRTNETTPATDCTMFHIIPILHAHIRASPFNPCAICMLASNECRWLFFETKVNPESHFFCYSKLVGFWFVVVQQLPTNDSCTNNALCLNSIYQVVGYYYIESKRVGCGESSLVVYFNHSSFLEINQMLGNNFQAYFHRCKQSARIEVGHMNRSPISWQFHFAVLNRVRNALRKLYTYDKRCQGPCDAFRFTTNSMQYIFIYRKIHISLPVSL